MKITKKEMSTDDPDYRGASRIFKMSDFDYKTLEFTKTQTDNALFTEEIPISCIMIEDFADSITLHFGNLCHIHLDNEQFKKFREGLDYIGEAVKEWDNAIKLKMTKKEDKEWKRLEKEERKQAKKAHEWYERNKI